FLPLAPLTNDAAAHTADVMLRALRRIEAETSPVRAGKLDKAMLVLLELRYEEAVIDQLIQEVSKMDETLVDRLLARERDRRTLVKMGRKKFGEPRPEQLEAVREIRDDSKIEALFLRLLDVSTWDELLAEEKS